MRWFFLLLIIPSVLAVVEKTSDEIVVITNHDHPSIYMIDGNEIIAISFDNRPTIVAQAVVEEVTAGQSAVSDAGNIVSEKVQEVKKQAEAVKSTKLSITKLFSLTTFITILIISSSFVGMVHFKELEVNGRTLGFQEKMAYYLARPYRIIYDTSEMTGAKKKKEKLKESF